MQKNSITNKITPCCGLPFSVMYWWVSNLTLNTPADRQYILSQISQNGTLSIDGWKALINSGTLEEDAALTKVEFLDWFNCKRKPSCEQLKIIIEGFQVSNWTPETELPSNLALIDKSANGINYVGNVYTKEQTDLKIAESVISGIKGEALTTTVPSATGFERYIAHSAGIYTNFKDSTGTAIEITTDDLNGNFVFLEVTDGVSKKHITKANDERTEIKWTEGIYLQPNGSESAAPWMSATNFFRILPNEWYSLNKNIDINYRRVNFFDENFSIISMVETQNFKTPSNAKYARISKETTEPVKLHHFKDFPRITISQTEPNDFESLNRALTFADVSGELCELYIKGKINITATLSVMQKHSFIGETPETSIIEFISNAELLRCSPSTYKNLTIKRTAVTEGYCTHPDYAGEGVVEFINCRILNNNGCAVGSGSHENQTLRFLHCYLENKSNGASFSPTLYWHNNANQDFSGQRLEVINCEIYSDYERPLQFHDQFKALSGGTATDSIVKFVNTSVYGALYGKQNVLVVWGGHEPIGTNTIAGNIKIHPLSSGNSATVLNYQ